MSMFDRNGEGASENRFSGLSGSRVALGSAVLGAALFMGVGVGCNTTEGVGEDVEEVGETIDNTAEDARREL